MTSFTAPTVHQAIIGALSAFAESRPGLASENYAGDFKAYRAGVREITRDLHDARKLLRVARREYATLEEWRSAFLAFSGRLQLTLTQPEASTEWTASLWYPVGQYYPPEFRRAVCAVVGTLLFDQERARVLRDWEDSPALKPHRNVIA